MQATSRFDHAAIAFACLLAWWTAPAHGAGEAARGATLFRACMACHSTAPGVHLTGPSLANIWGHDAGTVAGFSRYSDAMKRAKVVWNETTLDSGSPIPKHSSPAPA